MSTDDLYQRRCSLPDCKLSSEDSPLLRVTPKRLGLWQTVINAAYCPTPTKPNRKFEIRTSHYLCCLHFKSSDILVQEAEKKYTVVPSVKVGTVCLKRNAVPSFLSRDTVDKAILSRSCGPPMMTDYQALYSKRTGEDMAFIENQQFLENQTGSTEQSFVDCLHAPDVGEITIGAPEGLVDPSVPETEDDPSLSKGTRRRKCKQEKHLNEHNYFYQTAGIPIKKTRCPRCSHVFDSRLVRIKERVSGQAHEAPGASSPRRKTPSSSDDDRPTHRRNTTNPVASLMQELGQDAVPCEKRQRQVIFSSSSEESAEEETGGPSLEDGAELEGDTRSLNIDETAVMEPASTDSTALPSGSQNSSDMQTGSVPAMNVTQPSGPAVVKSEPVEFPERSLLEPSLLIPKVEMEEGNTDILESNDALQQAIVKGATTAAAKVVRKVQKRKPRTQSKVIQPAVSGTPKILHVTLNPQGELQYSAVPPAQNQQMIFQKLGVSSSSTNSSNGMKFMVTSSSPQVGQSESFFITSNANVTSEGQIYASQGFATGSSAGGSGMMYNIVTKPNVVSDPKILVKGGPNGGVGTNQYLPVVMGSSTLPQLTPAPNLRRIEPAARMPVIFPNQVATRPLILSRAQNKPLIIKPYPLPVHMVLSKDAPQPRQTTVEGRLEDFSHSDPLAEVIMTCDGNGPSLPEIHSARVQTGSVPVFPPTVQEDTFISFGQFEDITRPTVSGLIGAKTPSTARKQPRKKKQPAKPASAKKILTEEEKVKQAEERRRRQYASWTETVKVEDLKGIFSDSEESKKGEVSDLEVLSASSDFEPDEKIESTSESEEDLEVNESDVEAINEDDLVKKEKKNYGRRPEVKGPESAFTLDVVAKVLQTTVEELDAEAWERKIKTNFDDAILEELITLGAGKRRYKCFKCEDQIHGTVEDVASHMKVKHDLGLMFGCLLCPLGRSTEKALKYHERLHVHYNPKSACTICDAYHLIALTKMPEEVKDIDWRAIHAQHHPPIEDIAVLPPDQQIRAACKCVTCEHHPKRLHRSFSQHVYVWHVNVEMVCDLCGDVMNFWKLTHRHKPGCEIKHRKGPFTCLKCGVQMQTYGHFISHDCSGKHDCQICGAKFTVASTLKRHTNNVHNNIRKYTCQFCGKSFQEPMVLEDHINTHTGEKPYQCLACGTRHTSKAGLAMHLRSRHNLTTKEMKVKYKDCPIPEEPPEEPRERKGIKVEKQETPSNLYTGRKRGRPKVRSDSDQAKKVKTPRKKNESTRKPKKVIKSEEMSDSDSDGDEIGEHFLARQPKRSSVQKKEAKRRNTSSDSDDDSQE